MIDPPTPAPPTRGLPDPLDVLPREALAGDARVVAPALLGRYLRARTGDPSGEVVVRLTELEAYWWPGDSANHCFRGPTARNASMFGPNGHSYVYLCYGLHVMLNFVTGPIGHGAAVLVRAVEPVEGAPLLAVRRGGRAGPESLAGPGKVGAALALRREHDGLDLHGGGPLTLLEGRAARWIRRGARVGIDYAQPADRAAAARFAVADCPWVSHGRALGPGVEAATWR